MLSPYPTKNSPVNDSLLNRVAGSRDFALSQGRKDVIHGVPPD